MGSTGHWPAGYPVRDLTMSRGDWVGLCGADTHEFGPYRLLGYTGHRSAIHSRVDQMCIQESNAP